MGTRVRVPARFRSALSARSTSRARHKCRSRRISRSSGGGPVHGPAAISHLAHRSAPAAGPRASPGAVQIRGYGPVNGTAFVPATPAPSWGPLLDAVDRHVAPSGENRRRRALRRRRRARLPGRRGARPGPGQRADRRDRDAAAERSARRGPRRSQPIAARAWPRPRARSPPCCAAPRWTPRRAASASSPNRSQPGAADRRRAPPRAGSRSTRCRRARARRCRCCARLDAQLTPLLEAQRAGDWITVADILEYKTSRR